MRGGGGEAEGLGGLGWWVRGGGWGAYHDGGSGWVGSGEMVGGCVGWVFWARGMVS